MTFKVMFSHIERHIGLSARADNTDNIVMRGVSVLTVALVVAGPPLIAQQTAATFDRAASPSGRIVSAVHTDVRSTIQGNALDSTNGVLAGSHVRLRDARSGRIVDLTLTDRAGLFAFRAIDPGSYIVELMGTDQTVLAASQILNVNAGEVISAVVKLPFRIPPYAGVLGHSMSSAALVVATAAAAGVLATQVAGAPVSPPG
jgi:hypothetical protein